MVSLGGPAGLVWDCSIWRAVANATKAKRTDADKSDDGHAAACGLAGAVMPSSRPYRSSFCDNGSAAGIYSFTFIVVGMTQWRLQSTDGAEHTDGPAKDCARQW